MQNRNPRDCHVDLELVNHLYRRSGYPSTPIEDQSKPSSSRSFCWTSRNFASISTCLFSSSYRRRRSRMRWMIRGELWTISFVPSKKNPVSSAMGIPALMINSLIASCSGLAPPAPKPPPGAGANGSPGAPPPPPPPPPPPCVSLLTVLRLMVNSSVWKVRFPAST